MRHDLLLAPPLAVAGRPPRMREATGPAALVAPAGFAQRLASRRARAVAPAVALAAVAAAAHQHRGAAARAGERPCAALRLALPCTMHARLASVASALGRLALGQHGLATFAGCHTAHALAVNTSGARRLELLAGRCGRRARPVGAVLPRLHHRRRCRSTQGWGATPSTGPRRS